MCLTDSDRDAMITSVVRGWKRRVNFYFMRACVQSIRRRTAKKSNVVDPPVSADDIIKEVPTALL